MSGLRLIIPIISSIRQTTSPGGGGGFPETDAQEVTDAYLAAISTMNNDIKVFTQELEDAGAYDDFIACWLFLPGGPRYNYVDPYPETFGAWYLGAVTAHAKGISIDDTMEIDTGIVPNDLPRDVDTDIPLIGCGFYIQSPVTRVFASGSAFNIAHYEAGNSYPSIGSTSTGVPIAGGNKAGHWLIQRVDDENVEVWNEGVLLATDAQTYSSIAGADTIKINPFTGDSTQLSLVYIIKATTKQVEIDAAVQNLMSALNRLI
jgi:hypothetical protein